MILSAAFAETPRSLDSLREEIPSFDCVMRKIARNQMVKGILEDENIVLLVSEH